MLIHRKPPTTKVCATTPALESARAKIMTKAMAAWTSCDFQRGRWSAQRALFVCATMSPMSRFRGQPKCRKRRTVCYSFDDKQLLLQWVASIAVSPTNVPMHSIRHASFSMRKFVYNDSGHTVEHQLAYRALSVEATLSAFEVAGYVEGNMCRGISRRSSIRDEWSKDIYSPTCCWDNVSKSD